MAFNNLRLQIQYLRNFQVLCWTFFFVFLYKEIVARKVFSYVCEWTADEHNFVKRFTVYSWMSLLLKYWSSILLHFAEFGRSDSFTTGK